MKLLVHRTTRAIHDASNLGAWQVPPAFEVVEVPGDAETFAWPNGHPTRCLLDASGAIVGNPAWVPRVDRRALARARIAEAVGEPGVPRPVRDALQAIADALLTDEGRP
jgi:hypothetical protein